MRQVLQMLIKDHRNKEMPVSVRYLVLCLQVVLASSLAGCAGGGGTPAEAAAGRTVTGGNAIPVATAKVERRSMPLTIDVIGSAEASSTVAVRAQITGALTSVHFKEGDDVASGQVLFTLDRRPLEATLAQAQATLARDTAQATQAKASAARYQDLQGRGIATKEQADQSRTSAAALEATLQADRAAVENATVQLQYATIAAPIAGRTGVLMVHEGNLVRANDATPLVVINQVSPINVSFGIPEGRLPELQRYIARGSVRVDASPPGESSASAGRITFIDNAVDSTTGQIKVKASFPNADRRLWPGQFVNVSVVLSTEPDAIAVSAAAIQDGQQGRYVFVVKPDMTVDLRPVTVRRQVGDISVIETGLTPDEVVVTDGHLRLVAGSRVSIKSGTTESNSRVEP
jgi:membrane fusion protein, multidrug efflux system